MFHQTIVLLQRARKYVDKQMINLQYNNFLTAILDNVSLTLTMSIKDLIRVDKVLKQAEPKENTNE